MKTTKLTIVGLLLFLSFTIMSSQNTGNLNDIIDTALNRATGQSLLMAKELKSMPRRLPQTINNRGKLVTSDAGWWCSGFFPGVLWYLYENNNSKEIKEYAIQYTDRLKDQQYNKTTHDLGFMIFCSYGNGYRITKDTSYLSVIKNASYSLSTRFNNKIGCIRSWDYASWNKQWQYPVIIDNMMNLEMLLWSSEKFNIAKFNYIAKNHANTTIKNHFRKDNSSYHVVSYDTITGNPELKHTSQGYSHESAWARGQAWGLYGFTMLYRETGDKKYLKQAVKIADFIVNHPNLPEDKIPYWDFDAPNIPNEKRDASAGAIMSSALLELSTFTKGNTRDKYYQTAITQIKTLCSDEYLAQVGKNGFFILKHGVGHMPNGTEVDVPLTYADYYFIEAITRLKKLIADN